MKPANILILIASLFAFCGCVAVMEKSFPEDPGFTFDYDISGKWYCISGGEDEPKQCRFFTALGSNSVMLDLMDDETDSQDFILLRFKKVYGHLLATTEGLVLATEISEGKDYDKDCPLLMFEFLAGRINVSSFFVIKEESSDFDALLVKDAEKFMKEDVGKTAEVAKAFILLREKPTPKEFERMKAELSTE